MRKPILVATAYCVEAVETRFAQCFDMRRKEKNEHLAPDELLSLADGADAMLVTPADRLDAAFFRQVPNSSFFRSLVRYCRTLTAGLRFHRL
jgi:hypothetical protein